MLICCMHLLRIMIAKGYIILNVHGVKVTEFMWCVQLTTRTRNTICNIWDCTKCYTSLSFNEVDKTSCKTRRSSAFNPVEDKATSKIPAALSSLVSAGSCISWSTRHNGCYYFHLQKAFSMSCRNVTPSIRTRPKLKTYGPLQSPFSCMQTLYQQITFQKNIRSHSFLQGEVKLFLNLAKSWAILSLCWYHHPRE